MSYKIDQLCEDIRNNPESWRASATYSRVDGLRKGDICFYGYNGFTILTSTNLKIYGKIVDLSYRDSRKASKAIKWWLDSCNIRALLKTEDSNSASGTNISLKG